MNLQKQTGIAFALKIITTFTAFAYNWILAKLLGAEELGAFQIALTITMIGSVIASLGLNNAVLRLVSANIAIENYGLAKGIYRRSILFVGLAALLLTLCIQLFTKTIFLHFFQQKEALLPLIISMSWAIIPLALNSLFVELLKACGKFQVSLIVQNGISFGIATIGLCICKLMVEEVTTMQSIFIFIAALWLTLLIAIYFFNKNKPHILRGDIKISYNNKELLTSSKPLWTVAIASMAMEYLGILIIGLWIGTTEAGIFAIAKKIAGLNSYLLISNSSIIAPQIASLYAQNKKEELKNMVQKATKMLFWSGLVSLIVFSFLSKTLLGVFGTDFIEGWLILIILSLGQFVNVATGVCDYLLIMTKHETLFRTNMIISSITTIILCFILIPIFSTIGAALASALGMVFQNGRASWLVEKKLGFYALNLKYNK